MCAVNRADQLRSYYSTQRIHRKTQKPLFLFLLDTTIRNCYLLSSYKLTLGMQGTRKETHLQFRKDLYKALLGALTRPREPRGRAIDRKATTDITWRPVREHQLVKLFKKPKNCSACVKTGRKVINKNYTSRKSLADLSVNTTQKLSSSKDWKRPQRPPRTRYGCAAYYIPFCTV